MARPSAKYDRVKPQQNVSLNGSSTAPGAEGALMCAYALVGSGQNDKTTGVELVPPGRKKKVLFAFGIKATEAGVAGDQVRLFRHTSATSATSGESLTSNLGLNGIAVSNMQLFPLMERSSVASNKGIYGVKVASTSTATSTSDCSVFVFYTYTT